MPETQPSNLRIYFGLGGDDSVIEVKNITVKFSNEKIPMLYGKSRWANEGFTQIKVFYDCKGLHIVGKGNKYSGDGEMFFPTTSIFNIAVDWMDDYKGDMA